MGGGLEVLLVLVRAVEAVEVVEEVRRGKERWSLLRQSLSLWEASEEVDERGVLGILRGGGLVVE